jgi:hypothetical protein
MSKLQWSNPHNINDIIQYEQGELDTMQTIHLFANLVETGQAWSLQGHYGRMAQGLIDNGVLDQDGKINHARLNELLDNQE